MKRIYDPNFPVRIGMSGKFRNVFFVTIRSRASWRQGDRCARAEFFMTLTNLFARLTGAEGMGSME
jgi:hypothetical protein